MKTVIKSLKAFHLENNSIILVGCGGQITLTFLHKNTMKVEYCFDGVEIDSQLEKASEFICKPAMDLKSQAFTVQEDEKLFTIHCGSAIINITKETGNIAVWKNEVLIHGGSYGDSDTVLPSFPIRCLIEDKTFEGHWNFRLEDEDEFYGLGDKTGVPNHRNQVYVMYNRDALGYNASFSDPLYKSIPFFIKNNSSTGALCGLLFPQTMIQGFDFGRESVYSYSVKVLGGPFSYYLFWGDDYKNILNEYYGVSGHSIMPPLYSFGFMGSSMNYADPDDAPLRIKDFFHNTEKRGIPCEGMYVSSGYLRHPDGKRYTFVWNRTKFQDPASFFGSLKEKGYNFMMNIKPGILLSHPWYQDLKAKGYFIKDNDGKPYVEFFWGGDASFIDFSNPKARAWWKEQLKVQFLNNNCMGTWNDNNEYELEDTSVPAAKVKQIYPMLMCETACEAFAEADPNHRPWNYSRSGYAGIQRYARTWRGDNTSTWTALKYNQYMGMGFGLSGLPIFGHDIGGFAGTAPEEELLTRACETAVLQSRFVIHSWRPDGIPTTVWTYPNSEALIISLVKEHYRFLPYIYSCAYQNTLDGSPIERLLHLEFPEDQSIKSDDENCLFGSDILKINTLDKGVASKLVYLPASCNWIDPVSGFMYEGNQEIQYDVRLNGYAKYLVREGSAIVTSNVPNPKNSKKLLESLEILVYPGKSNHKSLAFIDDGETIISKKAYTELWFNTFKDKIEISKINIGFLGTKNITFSLPSTFTFDKNLQSSISFNSFYDIPAVLFFKGCYNQQQ